MKRRTVSVYMTDEQHAILTKRAQRQGISAYVKALIEKDIANFPKSAEWGENLLGNQYRDWYKQQTDYGAYDPALDQDGCYTYGWWLENVHAKK